jgi:hypothetical protein
VQTEGTRSTGPTNQALASDCVALDSKTVVACRITKNDGAATYNPNDISYTGPPPLPSNICSSLSFGTDGDRYVTYQGSVVANFVVAGIVTHYGGCVDKPGIIQPGEFISDCQENLSNFLVCLKKAGTRRAEEVEAAALSSSSMKGTALRAWFN